MLDQKDSNNGISVRNTGQNAKSTDPAGSFHCGNF